MAATLWLVGMMGVGKSAVGRAVAARAGARFLDTDALVAARAGSSIPEIWRSGGEESFRDLESTELLRLCTERAEGRRVVATGGGAVLRPQNVEAMRAAGLVVWLDAPAAVLAERVGTGQGRPLLAEGTDRLARILQARRPAYRAAAHHRVEVAGKSTEQVAEEVAELWTAS